VNHIVAAGNTVVPAILALEALGFRVEMSRRWALEVPGPSWQWELPRGWPCNRPRSRAARRASQLGLGRERCGGRRRVASVPARQL